eukprot:SAG31_NODE_28242_length_413_cov_0.824841_1_plen_29_part_10
MSVVFEPVAAARHARVPTEVALHVAELPW